jgi:hypothetical protein
VGFSGGSRYLDILYFSVFVFLKASLLGVEPGTARRRSPGL